MMSVNKVLNILTDLRDPESPSYYLALDGLLSQVCFRATNKQSQVVVMKTDANDGPVKPVIFSIVGQVSPVGSYLQANGSYIRSSKMDEKDDWRTAAKIKILLQPITNPKYATDLDSDWEKITDFVKNVHPLAFEGVEVKKQPISKTSPLRDNGGLLFQHTLLVPRNGEDNDDDLDARFTIEGYPVYGDYRHELDQFMSTHQIDALPAVSLSGTAIDPSQYASQLTGSIVRMDFSLENWNIKSSSKASLVAKIDCVTVLVPPHVPPSSPSKKRFRDLAARKATQDIPESPTKKTKTSGARRTF